MSMLIRVYIKSSRNLQVLYFISILGALFPYGSVGMCGKWRQVAASVSDYSECHEYAWSRSPLELDVHGRADFPTISDMRRSALRGGDIRTSYHNEINAREQN